MTDEKMTQLAINTIRTLSIDAVQQAKSGHPGTPMALAPLVVDAGANVLVAGSAIFSEGEGVIAAMKRLRAAANESK